MLLGQSVYVPNIIAINLRLPLFRIRDLLAQAAIRCWRAWKHLADQRAKLVEAVIEYRPDNLFIQNEALPLLRLQSGKIRQFWNWSKS